MSTTQRPGRPDRRGRGDGERRDGASRGAGRRTGRSEGTGRAPGVPAGGRDHHRDSRRRGRDSDGPASAGEDHDVPAVPEDADTSLLDRGVRAELRSLSKPNADAVARYLVVAGQALDSSPVRALAYARAARGRAARVGAVREAVGIAAYHAQEWAEALTELRTARRITGDARNLALIGDCERALGRPGQTVRLLSDPDVARLDAESRAELLIVAAGARRDLGQLDAALAVLARGGLDRDHPKPGSARLWYAYADALEAAGRNADAASWFAASAAVDRDGDLDAAERAADLL